MNELKLYQVDAFAAGVFKGNPAAVCPLPHWLQDEQLQAIAQENNLSETAFIIQDQEQYQIRWFTPNTEVALCGHATLASAFVIFERLGHKLDHIVFKSQSGELRVTRDANLLQMDFPALPYTKITPSPTLLNAINVKPPYLEIIERIILGPSYWTLEFARINLAYLTGEMLRQPQSIFAGTD